MDTKGSKFRFRLWITLALFSIAPWLTQSRAADATPALLKNIRQLTYDGKRSGEGYFSPDGTQLIFQSEREESNPFYQIYILHLQIGDSHRVSPGAGKTTCAFFRPGTEEVLFSSTHLDPAALEKQQAEMDFRESGQTRRYSWDYDERMDIFASRQDGTQIRRLTASPGYDAEGAWSPDGAQIVFCSLRSAFPLEDLSGKERKHYEVDPSWFGEIYLMNADGSETRRLTRHPGYDGGPFFSPAGDRIVWRRFSEDGLIADIYTMDLDGANVRQLTDFDCMSWAPYFHPSGQYIIFAANKQGFSNFELFLVDSNGDRQPVRVTDSDGFDGLPVFSPDGNRLCWTSNRNAGKQSQLYMAEWNHEAALNLLKTVPDSNIVQADAIAKAKTKTIQERLSSEITMEDLRLQVSEFASEEMAGRKTGTAGSRRAGDYLAETFASIQVKTLPGLDGWFQEFEFTSDITPAPEGNLLEISLEESGKAKEPGEELKAGEDFRPLTFTADGSVEGEVLFAGYGLSAPGTGGEAYDSYSGINATNKIVLVLDYAPEAVSLERRQYLNRYASLRYKAMVARENGAAAVLFFTGPNSSEEDRLIAHGFDNSLAGSQIIAASITRGAASTILSGLDKSLSELQSALDDENPHVPKALEVPGVRVELGCRVQRLHKTDRNVLAYVPPAESSSTANEFIVLGAHFDHLGEGGGDSLKTSEDGDTIHYGADDNASGTALVLELAARFADLRESQPEQFARGVVFGLWSGEEMGLIGSSAFTRDSPMDLKQAAAYLNFDMVGRLRENTLILQGVGSSTAWKGLLERKNIMAGFQLNLQQDPYLPTDATPFYTSGIPVLNFFTGSHEDYHRPSDTADKIDYEGLERISEFAANIALELVREGPRPDYAKVERSSRPGNGRSRLRAYLGTIPDYATEVAGVKLSGVRGGGPADKAGIQAGDVIVKFAGQKIANIYDYTYVLEAAKVGEPLKMKVERGGELMEFTIVPEARD